MSWSGYVYGYCALIQIKAPGGTSWDTYGSAGAGRDVLGPATITGTRTFPTVGTWSVRIFEYPSNNILSSQNFTIVPAVDSQAPTVPGGVSGGSLALTSFTLGWSAATDNVGVTAYEVMRGADSLGTTTTTSINVTGLTAGTAYAMKVRARDAAGNWSAWSAPVSVTTLADGSAPTSPAGLVASNIATTSFTLRWSAATDNIGVVAYEVVRDSTVSTVAEGPSLTITGLAPGTSYAMKVRARDAASNWSGWSPVGRIEGVTS